SLNEHRSIIAKASRERWIIFVLANLHVGKPWASIPFYTCGSFVFGFVRLTFYPDARFVPLFCTQRRNDLDCRIVTTAFFHLLLSHSLEIIIDRRIAGPFMFSGCKGARAHQKTIVDPLSAPGP